MKFTTPVFALLCACGTVTALTTTIWDGDNAVGTLNVDDLFATAEHADAPVLRVGDDAASAAKIHFDANPTGKREVGLQKRRWQLCRLLCICGSDTS